MMLFLVFFSVSVCVWVGLDWFGNNLETCFFLRWVVIFWVFIGCFISGTLLSISGVYWVWVGIFFINFKNRCFGCALVIFSIFLGGFFGYVLDAFIPK